MDTIVEYKVDPATQTSTQNIPEKQEETRDEEGKFLPGVSGNPNGRPKRKTITELIHEKLDKGDGELNWEQLTNILLSMAKRKDRDILKELWHYTDGMPKQKHEMSGPDGGPIPIMGGTSVPSNNSLPKAPETK
jgi:hypothetical protein